MSSGTPRPIRIPWREHWRDARLRLLPVLVFTAAVISLGILWRDHVASPAILGQVEPVEARVSCYKPGVLAQLSVARFQKVKAGDPVGQVLVTEPKILASSLAVIQAEIEMLRVNMQPIAAQQRNAMNYSQLRLDWMRQRAQLAMAKVNLQLAEAELRRTTELYKEKLVSEQLYEQASSAQQRFQNEVRELGQLVEEQANNFEALQLTNAIEISKITDQPLRAAIAAQEAKLRLTEAELSPITLQAPVDGMVDLIFHRPGEALPAREPIVAIAAFSAVRIVSYLRPPVVDEPKVGSKVQVRTRGPHRQVGAAEIVEVGTQFEPIAPALQTPLKLVTIELGLPIGISLPQNLKIRPGELVDVRLLRSIE